MSRQNIKPHVSQRKPVFHLINKPNFLAGSGFDGNAGFIDINHPSTLDNTRLPVSNSNLADNDLSHTEDIKDYSPIFSLPNPFTVGLNINNNLPGLNESSLSGVETGSGESEGAAEEKKQSSAAEIYLSGYSNRLSASITSSPRDSQGKDEISKSKKKRTASLKKEELEYNKSLAKKLTANFVDYYLKQDFYHKLNLLKDPYKNLQIKSYLRDNLILNLIFIQKFKEFKFYDKNFHLNLNLLPTSLSEFFDVFKTQNTKEEINNYLNSFSKVLSQDEKKEIKTEFKWFIIKANLINIELDNNDLVFPKDKFYLAYYTFCSDYSFDLFVDEINKINKVYFLILYIIFNTKYKTNYNIINNIYKTYY